MTNRETTEPCPICDSRNTEIRFDRERQIKYLRRNHVIDGLEHTVCLECGCSFNAHGQIERNNQRFFEFEKSILDGIIAPRKIVELRQTYNLTQEQAKNIFKSTGNLFSKWERGESAPSSAVSNLLEAALEDKVIMDRLARRAGVSLAVTTQRESTPIKSKITSWAGKSLQYLVSDHDIVEDRQVTRVTHTKQTWNNTSAVIYVSAIQTSPTIGSKVKSWMKDDELFSQCPEAYMIKQLGAAQ